MGYQIELVNLSDQPAAVIRDHVALDGIGEFLGAAFGDVMGLVSRQGLQVAGAPFGRYRPAADGGFDVEAGFPVTGAVTAEGRVESASLPGGRAARTVHVGDYGGVGAAYEAVTAWLAGSGLVPAGDPWECYLDGPEVANPRTEVFFPCREGSAVQAPS
jgi:effector-binding domain-containing protein